MLRNKGLSIRVAMLASCAFAVAGSPALAQGNQAATGEDNADEIVVTAQFRAQSLQDTPIAITAVSSEQLAARGQTDASQIAAQAPSVNLQPGTGAFGPSLAASIRGVGQYDFNPAVEPGVGFYVDDVYYPSLTGAIFDLLDLERLEILRGPQGTLAGRNSVGGAIKLYSKRPSGDNSGMLSATYGSGHKLGLRGSLDLGITPSLSARISGSAKRQDGYVDVLDFGCVNAPGTALNPAVGGIPAGRPNNNCKVAEDGNVNYQALRGQLRYNPGSGVDITASAEFVNDDRRPSALTLRATRALTPAQTARIQGPYTGVVFDSRFICGNFCNYETGLMPSNAAQGLKFDTSSDLYTRYQGYGLALRGEFQLADKVQLTSITGYRDFNTQFVVDADLSPLAMNQGYNALYVDFFSQELRLSGSLVDDKVNYTFGGFYSTETSVYPTIQDLRPNALQFASLGDNVLAKTFALFGHVSWELLPGLTVNGGVRRTHESKDYQFSRRFVDGTVGVPSVGSLDGLIGKYAETRWDYRANVQYAFTKDIMGYAQFSTGYKGGGINPRPFFATQVQSFGAEALNAWEVGLKTDLFDRVLRLNLAAFHNEYKNLQLTLTSCPAFTPGNAPAPCAMTANAGDARIQGLEAESVIRLFDGLTIDGSFSYLDFKYKRLNAAVSGVPLTNTEPYMSDLKWSLSAQYEIKLGGGSTLTPRIDASHQSKFYAAASNSPASMVPAYTLLNANMTWRNANRDLDVTLQVTNLADEYYLLGAFENLQAGFATVQPARPREWSLTVSKRF